ncbi:MAG: hypothetical protein NTY56_03295, partial [Patescibacteria group bacterium]|nr:hypothetical protein [Patescibacteria group bacterium]
MTTSNHRETSGEFEFPGSRLAADLRQQSIAMNRFMNKFGGYKSGSTGAVDSVAFINGAPGNCFAATIPIVEEFRTYEMRQGIPNKTGFFIGFPSDHGKKQSNGSIRASHTTLFAVDPSTLTVVEANLMGYENLDPTVLIEQDLSQVLQDLDSTDLTVLNSDPDFRETYSVTKEGNQVDFKIYEYQDAIYNYL